MELLLGRRMGKTGRPPKSAGDAGTKQVRVFEDLAEMLSDLSLVHPKSTAQILDPLIRAEVEDLHEKYRPQIEKAKAAKKTADEQLQRIKDEAERIANQQPEPKKKRGQ